MKLLLCLLICTNVIFAKTKEFTLKEVINIALENNHKSKISKVALEIANAQYNQALSANYPALNAMVVGQRKNEDVIFQQRGTFSLPSELTKTLALANTLSISDSATRTYAQSQIAATPLSAFPEGTISADIDSTALGRDTIKSSLNLLYPLFTGGKISSVIEQAKLNKLLAMNTIRRNDLDVVYDIKKYFYGYVLTNELYKIAKSTLTRMNYISTLTKQFYESGESLNVKKTDYLSIQVTVALIESIVAKIEANRFMVRSALSNAMGLAWDSEIKLKYTNNELLPPKYSLSKLVQDAYRTNSDIRKMDIALKISKEQIKEQKAGHYPSVALMGELAHTYNSYEYGYLSDDKENTWNIGFAAQIPLFDGFKTTNMVSEKKLEKKKLYLLQDMLKEGVALQIKNELNNALIGFKQIQTLKKAKKLARDSRELNVRGYQIDAIEPQKVIEAQYIESYVKADYLKYVHDYLLSLAKIDNLIGQEVK
ncbi:TolC family protein [Poseidonibacter lekithochrous]|uniref:TolC family protein n=1 Tax=Poseidonibacter TaxID=2321187 RepID=UPI001C09C349|nr:MULTISPECIES: TolC family protein [Poseidonibacter]MBU3013346.1 TolC family protein [Poseidonibacter lekithochrous]MDO6826643.1 TolC family protein [Poseidonibacter sp. 1_MG-2023]